MSATVEGPFCSPSTSKKMLPLPQHARALSGDKHTSSSYSSTSAPQHRRSSFPTSPTHLELGETGKTAAPSYFYLPPGIGLRARGCGEGLEGVGGQGDQAANGGSSFQFDDGGGVCVAATGPAVRKSSFGSNTTSASSSQSTSTTTRSTATSATSLSLSSDQLGSTNSATPAPKRPPHQPAPGEDPQLAAARRALWEDVPLPTTPGAPSPSLSVFSSDAAEQDGDSDDDSYCSSSDDEANPRSLPGHATLPPLPSILRPPFPRHSSHHSSASTSASASPASSTISVRISSDPPRAFTTFSPTDYERKGAAPVEKLSIREWIELQGVREAVGVWSGRIGKWEGDDETSASAGGEGAGGKVKDPMSESVSSLTSLDLGASAEDGNTREKEVKTCGHLAGVMGVRTVGHNISPVEQSSSLFD